jgi:hypothetical protein
MRHDMAKVLVERPRLGTRERLKRCKRHQRPWRDPDDTLEREPMSRGRGTKHLSENFGPLTRYLQSQVGRPWDKVYAEISAHLRPTNAVQQHVRDHLEDFVMVRVWRDADGLVGANRWGKPVRVDDPFARTRFYVDPRGLLRACKQKRQHARQVPDSDVRWDGAWRQLRRIDGMWYAFQLAPVPRDASERARARDAFFGTTVRDIIKPEMHDALHREYGRCGVFAARKRQLSKRELRGLAALETNYKWVRP